MTDKEQIIELLSEVDREGIQDLLSAMDKEGFYTGPASTIYHGAYKGGLAHHSLKVAQLFIAQNDFLKLGLNPSTCALIGVSHDLCKVGRYIKSGKGYLYNFKNRPPFHGITSMNILSKFIELSDLEKDLIIYHMGPWNTKEFAKKGEYTLKELMDTWNKNKAVRILYFCDETATIREGIEDEL